MMDPTLLARCKEIVTDIKDDIERDVAKTEGMAFTGHNVAVALGELSGCLFGLVGVVEKMLEAVDASAPRPGVAE